MCTGFFCLHINSVLIRQGSLFHLANYDNSDVELISKTFKMYSFKIENCIISCYTQSYYFKSHYSLDKHLLTKLNVLILLAYSEQCTGDMNTTWFCVSVCPCVRSVVSESLQPRGL